MNSTDIEACNIWKTQGNPDKDTAIQYQLAGRQQYKYTFKFTKTMEKGKLRNIQTRLELEKWVMSIKISAATNLTGPYPKTVGELRSYIKWDPRDDQAYVHTSIDERGDFPAKLARDRETVKMKCARKINVEDSIIKGKWSLLKEEICNTPVNLDEIERRMGQHAGVSQQTVAEQLDWLVNRSLVPEINYGLLLVVRGHIIEAGNWRYDSNTTHLRQKLIHCLTAAIARHFMLNGPQQAAGPFKSHSRWTIEECMPYAAQCLEKIFETCNKEKMVSVTSIEAQVCQLISTCNNASVLVPLHWTGVNIYELGQLLESMQRNIINVQQYFYNDVVRLATVTG